jgi:hypothetical protein
MVTKYIAGVLARPGLERLNDWASIGPVQRAALEEFAELIILECARIARATPCPYDDEEIKQVFGHTWDIAALAAGRNINDYFGVGL